MLEDPADACPPDAENNTAEAPAPRPAPLQRTDQPDVGCLILLGVTFIGVFLLPAAFLLGGAPVIIPLITCLLLALAAPFLNPLERRPPKTKWWGRIITFLILAGLVAGAWLWLLRNSDVVPEVEEYSRLTEPCAVEA